MNSTITGTILNDEYGGDGNDDNATQETQDDNDKDKTRRSGWDGKANSKKNVTTKLLAMKRNVASGRRTDSSQMWTWS